MFIYEPMDPLSIFSMDITNLDVRSENFTLEYYLFYLEHYGNHFITIKRRDSKETISSLFSHPIIGYIFGKPEIKTLLCMHISALSVAPSYRTSGLGSELLRLIEENGNKLGAYFSDLYVRSQNAVATGFYTKKGYVLYRKVHMYYADPVEDAWDMRKSLKADPNKECMTGGRDIHSDCLFQ
ncbi:N-terminal acetyltransferase B complex catalytic subunit [Pancytospora epiphaga]|nr:N-terminal acetyltransferase B complex catalytic subunit [Pancytospora epiphaga]